MSSFYGFLPLIGYKATVATGGMVGMSFCQLLSKCVGLVALKNCGGGIVVLSVLGGELALYLLYKLLRGDLRCWTPIQSNAFSVFFSFTFYRPMVFIVSSFTGMFHMRHPVEMGGMAWVSEAVELNIYACSMG